MGNFDKRPELEIPQEDPFANDLFNRQSLIKPLTRLITSMEKPFVLSVEASWGHGKTTFVKMWEQYLKNEGIVTLYYNAWENDYTEDPLASLIICLSKQLKSEFKNLEMSKKADNLLTYGGKLAKIILPILLGVGTRGLIDRSSVESVEKMIKASDYEKLVAETSKGLISAIDEQIEANNSFKKTLEEITNQLKEQDKLPLVIFVDELDRCRPDFALLLLERIKHLFNTNYVIFILSIDRSQLEESIKAVYGNGINATEYLRRFIDQSFSLNKVSNDNTIFIDTLFNAVGLENYINDYLGNIREHKKLIQVFSNEFSFSLRKIEQIINSLNIILRTLPERFKKSGSKLDLTTLLLMKFTDPILYLKIEGGDLQTIAQFEEKLSNIIIENKYLINWHGIYAKLIPNNQREKVLSDLSEKKETIGETNPEKQLLEDKYNELMSVSHQSHYSYHDIKDILEAINLTNLFFN